MSEMEVNIGLSQPKTPTNVAVVLRAAHCFQANSVLFEDKEGRYDRAARFHTDTQKSEEKIPLIEVSSLKESTPKDNKLVCVELVEGATSLTTFTHPDKAFYVFGPEDGSLSQEIINEADEVVYIPTSGCLNVAMAVNVVLYDRLQKSNLPFDDEEIIRNNRNFNNRLVFNK